MTLQTNQIQLVKDACALYNVRTLFAFGSVTNDKFNADSDVDLVVDISESDPFKYSDNYFSLKRRLEHIFNRQIDLLELRAIRNPFRKQEIDRTKVLLYDT